MKPLWEVIHDSWIDDFKFDLQQIKELQDLHKKHIYDSMGPLFMEMIKNVQKHLEILCKNYKKIYGTKPNIWRLKNGS